MNRELQCWKKEIVGSKRKMTHYQPNLQLCSSCDVSDLNSKIKNLENDKLSLVTAIKLIQVRRTISILKHMHAANRRGLIAILLPTSWTNKCRP